MQPIVHGLETEFVEQLVVERLNANSDTGKGAMTAYSLHDHPSYALVDPGGSVMWSAVGPLSLDQLRQAIQKKHSPTLTLPL